MDQLHSKLNKLYDQACDLENKYPRIHSTTKKLLKIKATLRLDL